MKRKYHISKELIQRNVLKVMWYIGYIWLSLLYRIKGNMKKTFNTWNKTGYLYLPD